MARRVVAEVSADSGESRDTHNLMVRETHPTLPRTVLTSSATTRLAIHGILQRHLILCCFNRRCPCAFVDRRIDRNTNQSSDCVNKRVVAEVSTVRGSVG